MYMKNISILSGTLIVYNKAMDMNNSHIIYHHMDASWSVGYLLHPDYLGVLCWVCAVVLFPDSVAPGGLGGLKNPHFIKFFPRGIGHMHEDTPCHCIMAIIDVVHPFIVRAYPSP